MRRPLLHGLYAHAYIHPEFISVKLRSVLTVSSISFSGVRVISRQFLMPFLASLSQLSVSLGHFK
jgi:hypothetical protein